MSMKVMTESEFDDVILIAHMWLCMGTILFTASIAVAAAAGGTWEGGLSMLLCIGGAMMGAALFMSSFLRQLLRSGRIG